MRSSVIIWSPYQFSILEIAKLFGTVANSDNIRETQNKPQKDTVVKGSLDLNSKENVLLKQASEVSAEEFGYEIYEAIVCKRSKDPFGIRDIPGNIIWNSEGGSGHSYFELVKKGTSDFLENWDGKHWPEAGAGTPRLVKTPKHKNVRLAIKVKEEKIIVDERWFRILILPNEVCSGETQSIQGSGWILAHGKNGKPLVQRRPRRLLKQF
ncbi:MAG: hypothetical protein WCI18_08890 [Pseudomonadota bacterium]